MDAVTAVSGSGPAYVFLFLGALIAAGVKQGLPQDIAAKLALHTLRGSTKLAMKSEESLEQLRKNVTSPGGTTEAALKVLMKEDALASLMDEAVAAAVKRSKELA
jgi:pyrroline-5-carboxylate reductase